MSAAISPLHRPQHHKPFVSATRSSPPPPPPPPPRKSMSVTQTYYLAHKARAKLSYEAARSDHDLRLLVGHANLLDSLMLELVDAEREQERWFNQSVRGAAHNKTKTARRVQWADRIEEEAVAEDVDSDADSDSSDLDDDEVVFETASAVPVRLPPLLEDEDDLEDDYAHLELVRTPSHSSSPPDLMDSDSESSDDEPMPPSPGDQPLPYSEDEAKRAAASGASFDEEDEYYSPQREAASLVSAISVY